jgi:hypothetical protein
MISRELVQMVVENGIKAPIRMLVERRHCAAALVLTYSAIDTMAYLNMPENKTDVMRSDFITWAETYVVGTFGRQITGRDLYATRCSVLHGGAQSRLSRGGECRLVSHATGRPSQPDAFHASVQHLIDAVLAGIDRFLSEASANLERAETINARLRYLTEALPYGS